MNTIYNEIMEVVERLRVEGYEASSEELRAIARRVGKLDDRAFEMDHAIRYTLHEVTSDMHSPISNSAREKLEQSIGGAS